MEDMKWTKPEGRGDGVLGPYLMYWSGPSVRFGPKIIPDLVARKYIVMVMD